MAFAPRSLLAVIAISALGSWALRGHVSAEDGRRMAQRVKPGDIRMISSETCGWCTAARRWMTAEGVPFSECFIERDAQCAADYRALGGMGTPVVVAQGRPILGFDRPRILAALEAGPAVSPAAGR